MLEIFLDRGAMTSFGLASAVRAGFTNDSFWRQTVCHNVLIERLTW